MRYSEMFLPTTRENPSDAEIVSHQLMIRAGMIRKLTSGIYSYLPLGYRVIKKMEQIVREEMDRTGAQEVFLPAVQPAELWQESGRWHFYGKELARLKDRHDRDYCIGPTHEEVITDLVRREIQAYRQLPLNLYQIQTKFRDEIRPRFGVMRCREFIMKDAYSFDVNESGAELSYKKMYEAYTRIFRRCGLRFGAVEADSGTIGGSYSHEFMVTADSGEDAIVVCTSCDYSANVEKAEILMPEKEPVKESVFLPREEVLTPDVKTIDEISAFLDVSPQQVLKTMIFLCDDKPIAVLVRGDEEINEAKLINYLGCDSLQLATDEIIAQVTEAPRGFAGPVGIKCKVVADYSLINMKNFVVGANKENYHIKNCNIERDFQVEEFADLRLIEEKDTCPRCKSSIKIVRGIEVGHVFKLGTKYSEAMKATFLDKDGREKLMIMGCYGIGIGRTVAASIEQNHDEYGIIWPMPLAPFQVVIIPINVKKETLMQAAEDIYAKLAARGIEVLLDDRDERAGVKFNDADLIGIPLRITVGPKKLEEGCVELKIRKSGDEKILNLEELETFITATVDEELQKGQL